MRADVQLRIDLAFQVPVYRQIVEVSYGKALRVVDRGAPKADAAAVEQFRTRLRRLVAEAWSLRIGRCTLVAEFKAVAEAIK